MTNGTGSKRGGRRPGAGAPRGNKHALKSGRYSRDAHFRTFWDSLTPDQQRHALPALKGMLWDSAAGEAAARDEVAAPNVVPFEKPSPSNSPQYTHTQTQTIKQSNQRVNDLIGILVGDFEFFGARRFVEKHLPALDVIEQIVTEYRDAKEHTPEAVAGIAIDGAFLRNEIHTAISQTTGRLTQCPHCPFKQFRLAMEAK